MLQRLRFVCSLCLLSMICLAEAGSGVAHAAPSTSAQAVAVALRDQASGKVGEFYKKRGYWPLWASNGTLGPETATLITYLETAYLDGLKPSSYKPNDLREAVAKARSGEPKAVARAELQLSSAFARYAGDLQRRPMAEMTYLEDVLKPQKLRAGPALRRAAFSTSLSGYVRQMGWMSPHYLRLRTLLARAEKVGSSDETLRRLRTNLNRARALPGPAARHVVVDAASGRLWYYEAGKEVGTMRVITGTPKTPTPMFAGMINYAILNPYWNVPVDLATSKVAPKILAGRSLKTMRMEALSDWGESATKVKQSSIDWKAVAAGQQEVRLRQLPGTTNAMGRVKFLFPNQEGIYLHDTPERDLFKKTDRHFSNGCIRLEDAARLGNWLLGKSIKAGSKAAEQAVPLPAPVPIYITYFTATTGKSGELAFLKDVYRRDP
jgi:L,D-transpeptidase YcbB